MMEKQCVYRIVAAMSVVACLHPITVLDTNFAGMPPSKAVTLLTRQRTQSQSAKHRAATVQRKAAPSEDDEIVRELVDDYFEDGHNGNDYKDWIARQSKKQLKTSDSLDLSLTLAALQAEQGWYLDAGDTVQKASENPKLRVSSVGKVQEGDGTTVILDVSIAKHPSQFNRSSLFVLHHVFSIAGKLEEPEDAVEVRIQTAPKLKGAELIKDPSVKEWMLSQRRVVEEWLNRKGMSWHRDDSELVLDRQSICELAYEIQKDPNPALRDCYNSDADEEEEDEDEEDEDEDEEDPGLAYDDDDDYYFY